MTSLPHRTSRRSAAAFSLALALGALGAQPARAEDAEGADVEREIREQMEKVIKLMRENEKAILEASLGSGKRPEGVDVKPPEAPEAPSGGMEGDEPAESGMGEGAPTGGPDEVKRRIEELIRTTEQRGGSIPAELQELVRLIPTTSSSESSSEGGDPQNSPRDGRDLPKPEDATKKGESGEEKSEKSDGKPDSEREPGKSETGEPASNGPPAWFAELPEAMRRAIISGRVDDVPARYRPLFERYRAWLAKQAGRESR